MRSRLAFSVSIASVFVALIFLFAGRGQLEEGYRIRSQTGTGCGAFPAHQSFFGAAFIYSSVPFAIGSLVCTFLSWRRRESAWRWISIVLLCFYMLVLVSPV